MAAQPQDFAKVVRVGILNTVFQFNVKFNQPIENKMNNILEYCRCIKSNITALNKLFSGFQDGSKITRLIPQSGV